MKRALSTLFLIFVFVLIQKGWEEQAPRILEDTNILNAEGVKAVYFWNKPGLDRIGYYSIGGIIAFYNPTLPYAKNLRVAWHELGHHLQYSAEGRITEEFPTLYADLKIRGLK